MTTTPVRYLVAVTAYVNGIAHTYMAAERLEKLCQREKWSIKTEAQGILDIENRLMEENINRIDVVLPITDIELAGTERFTQGRYVRSGISVLLCEPQWMTSAARKLLSAPQHIHPILDQLLSSSISCGITDDILMVNILYFCEIGGRGSCCQQTYKYASLPQSSTRGPLTTFLRVPVACSSGIR